MTTTKEKIEVMQSFLDGKQIQIIIGSNSLWEDLLPEYEPIWDWECCNYRVKPEPKIRPYRLQCEFAEAVREHGPMVFEVETGYYSTILGTIENQNVQIDCNKITFDALLEYYKWQDGTPCGIMEETK